MEASYSSQVSLSTSTPPTPTSASPTAGACHATTASTSGSTVTEPRHSRKDTIDGQVEEGNERDIDMQHVEDGSDARPRAMLRRRKTSTQSERSEQATPRLRRTSLTSGGNDAWTAAQNPQQIQSAVAPAIPQSATCPSLSHTTPLARSASQPAIPFTRSMPVRLLSTPLTAVQGPLVRRRANSLPTSSSWRPIPAQAIIRPSDESRPRLSVKLYDSNDLRSEKSRSERKQPCSAPRPPRRLSLDDVVRLHASRLAHSGIDGSCHLAPVPLLPPISRSTLRELDLPEVLRNAQLRHDVVFDPNLMFRPNLDGARGERKRASAEQYWMAVSREVTLGCRCTTFFKSTLLPCICPSLDPSAQLPTRIVSLVAELRGILLSLLPASTSASPNMPSTAVFPPVETTSSQSMPCDGLREELLDALDPVVVCQQLVQGTLDVAGLARFLGDTLKTHCAPMRDDLVDEMVTACEGHGVVIGLRLCFEVLELMKLDIANHQLRSLRPYLLQSSVEFERRFLEGATGIDNALTGPNIPRTESWICQAADSFTRAGGVVTQDPASLVDRIVTQGVLDLVFSPQQTTTKSPSSLRAEFGETLSAIPEALQLDAFRMAHFHCDATDLTIVYMLLLLYQQLSSPARPSAEELDLVRHELWCIISPITGFAPSLVGPAASSIGIPQGLPGVGVHKLENVEWRRAMKDALLQVAARVQETKSRAGSATRSSILATPEPSLIALVEGYFEAHARSSSHVFQLLSKRLQNTLQAFVDEELACEKARSDYEFINWWSPSPQGASMRTGGRRIDRSTAAEGSGFMPTSSMMASPCPINNSKRGLKRSHSADDDEAQDDVKRRCAAHDIASNSIALDKTSASAFTSNLSRNGLGVLSDEIRVLGARITKVTSFNLSVFRPMYHRILSERFN
ncbi:Sok1p [Sporobolomyces koalae]|uniref:Sok1p n=1 Tax=Sporobolomyces koalae TaxID=500713 RepID=UPI00316C471A